MRSTISINGTLRDGFLKECDENNTLGMHTMDKKDIYLWAVSLGLDSPEDLKAKKDAYFRCSYLKEYDISFFASILLGCPENRDNIDKYANEEINFIESERCDESGFNKLKEFVESANGDHELLEKRALAKLQFLYQKNVVANI